MTLESNCGFRFSAERFDKSYGGGVFTDGTTVFTAYEYWDSDTDEPEDAPDRGKGYIIGQFDAKPGSKRENDAFYYGYKTVADLLDGEFTTDCRVILADDPIEAEDIDELAEWLSDEYQVDLWSEVAKA